MEKKTQQRVLESACAIFAQKGFRQTTVAEICEQAGANVAAVNYYFRNKESLYQEVWQRASEVSEEKYGFDGIDLSNDIEWLKRHVSNRVRSILDNGPAGCFPRLLQREFSDRSPMANDLREKFLAPKLLEIEAVVQRLLGSGATSLQVRCCTMNIVGLHAFLNIGKEVRSRMFDDGEPSTDQIDKVVEQMQAFALSAVDGVRKAIDEGGLS